MYPHPRAADQPLGVLPTRLDAAVRTPPPSSSALPSLVGSFVARAGSALHFPRPGGREVPHSSVVIILRRLRMSAEAFWPGRRDDGLVWFRRRLLGD